MRTILGLLAVLAMLFSGCTSVTPTSTPDTRGQMQNERQTEGGGGGGGSY